MFSNDDDQGLVLGVVFGVILLAIATVLGVALYKTGQRGAAPAPAPAAAVVPMPGLNAAAGTPAAGEASAGTAMPDAARVVVEGGVVKFYFASGSADLAPGAAEALGDVVKGVAAGKKAVISGYHDTTGDPAKNEELSKQRAFAVRDALAALGIGEDKMELRKPADSTASGNNAEARRVEVTLE